MSIKPPLMDLEIETADSGFYAGFSKNVAVISKIIIALLVIWAVVFPDSECDQRVHLGKHRLLVRLDCSVLRNSLCRSCALANRRTHATWRGRRPSRIL